MREIKFRGFNRKNNQWLYGFYLQNRGAHFVCPDEFATNKSWDDYEVDPETVGQFTGLLDEDKREVYEGDVIRLFGVVRTPCVVVKFIRDGFFSERPNGNLCPLRNELMVGGPGNIIGNIHDNLELIEE